MNKRMISAYLLCLCLTFPLASYAQQPSFVPRRLLIKYESPKKLHQLKSKGYPAPKSAVEQLLQQAGAQSIRPLFQQARRRKLRSTSLPEAQALLQIYTVTFSRDINPPRLAAKVERMPGVAYAEPKYRRYLHFTPNDPNMGKFIDFHRFNEAWEFTAGDPKVVIAIVDGGVGYTHPELNDKLWINQDEVPATLFSRVDQNADGRVTSTEINSYLQSTDGDFNGDGRILLDDAVHPASVFANGTDDDSNGFTDDLLGWDFWSSGVITQPTTDNNPFHDGTDHGTHVAGIASAETNNKNGIAGAGFNSTYMAVKAGGTPSAPRSVGFGFEGMLYAAEEGADIINCSWGGPHSSEAEQDIINYVTRLGATVVSSAGNEGVGQLSYPAAYHKVTAVGSVETTNSVAGYSNYGYKLDVLATGSQILSTSYDSSLTTKSGTSMSAPVVSGLAGLLKAIHPNWSAERIGRQIRTSSAPVTSANPDRYTHKLGHGKIDAFNALNTNNPGLKVIASRFINSEGTKLQLNQAGMLNLRIVNVGRSASGIEARLQPLTGGGIELGNTSQSLPTLATNDTTEISFDITITNDFDFSDFPTFRLNFTDPAGNYSDFNIIRYRKLLYEVVAANRVKTSFAADGTVGFTFPFESAGGVGFIPRRKTSGGYIEGNNLLFEGGLMVEIDGRIYDAVRTDDGARSRDFLPTELFTTTQTEAVSDLDGHASFRIGNADSTHNGLIRLRTYAYDNPQLSNVVFVEYTIRNSSSFHTLENMYAGLFNDWDIGNSSDNASAYSKADSVLYLYESDAESSAPVTAVAHLGPVSGILAINNAVEQSQDSLRFGIYDGFTNREKSLALKAGVQYTEVENTDASAVVASGPYTLEPGARVTLGFIYAFGENPEELREQIAAARAEVPFEVSPTGRATADMQPTETRLFQNYPNPFRERTQIRFDLREPSHVTLTIYDILGRKVRVLVDDQLEARSHFIEFNAGGLSSGIYFARLKTDRGLQTLPMTLIK